jgi:1-carboxybiuret hydrolase subunit AtzG-like
MGEPDDAPLTSFMRAGATLLALPLDAAWEDSIRGHLRVTLRHAALVDAFELPDDAEPAPVFKA